MRAAIWLRVSTDMQVEGDSPLHHEKRARAYAEGKNWDVIEVYRLDAVSGKSVIDHPETKRMIADIRSGHVKALIFSKLARLARNTRELLTFSDLFQECSANLISLGESIDTTSPAGRLYFTLIAALTQWEREEIASRVAASVPIRAKLGKKLGGAAPYGLRWQEDRLVADPVEAPVRKHMYELFLKERRIRTVARLLNERGYRTRSGADWTGTSIERLIKDPTGKGTRIANYTRTTDSKKAWKLKDPKDWVYLPCDPIVSEEVWQQANDILSGRKKTVLKTGRPAVQLFGGLTKCHCGQKMYVRSKSPTKYVCTACTNKIPIADLDALFLSEIASFFVDEEEVTDRMLEIDENITAREELLSSCLAEQKKLQKEFDLIYKLYVDGQIDQWGFGSKYEPIKARLAALDEEIPTLQAGLDAAKISRLSRAEVMHEAKDLHSRWPSLDRSEKRAIIEAITEEIIVGIDEVTIALLSCSHPKGSHNATREHLRVAFLLPGIRYKRTVSRFNHLQIGQLGRALRSYRFRLKLRQIDVAKMVGVDAFTIVNWERGKTEPEPRHIPRLTELLGKDHQPRAHTIWTKLRRFRKSLGLTQAEFATLIQANETSVWRWEQGRGIIPKRVLRMMGKPVIFHAPKTRISLSQLNAWKTRWEESD